ncbi:transposase [Stieleria magnilauensis]|uniref:Transposase DDE domain protein n=2 Tax=Stieleria magnilauensis TaxID=2527963 RepID=A0ABX5XLJ8_9BACT|nr:Transposase DDE domain protein [Planctomycetes bacterium TBK1r]QDV84384.1 Transposase DDE domain protein [Planctomycetes bacterium TBK1r]
MVISPADIDAVIGKDKKKVVRPLYNVQYMTDCASDVIVAYGVWAQNNDNGTLVPMIQKTKAMTAGRLRKVHADSGYCSILDLQDCTNENIDLFAPVPNNTAASRKLPNGEIQIPSKDFCFDESTRTMTCPNGNEMRFVKEVQVPRACGRTVGELRFEQSASVCSACPLAFRCIGGKSKRRTVARQSQQGVLDAQKTKMESEQGKRSGRLRGQVIERRFADGKLHRNQEPQNGRGLHRVRPEVGLLAVAQNTLTLYNLEKRGPKPAT